MNQLKLYMILLGCKPAGRNTEQHDVFFGIGKGLKELLPIIRESWPQAGENLHMDAWREVTSVDGYPIVVEERTGESPVSENHLYFINLGGYKEGQFEEFHYKTLIVAAGTEEAKAKAKKTAFYKHTSLENSATHHSATAHIDDKYGIDIDDIYKIQDILPAFMKVKYEIRISHHQVCPPDEMNLGYMRLQEI